MTHEVLGKKISRRRHARTGRGIPYISRNKVYFGRGKQTGSGVITRLLTKALQVVADIIGV